MPALIVDDETAEWVRSVVLTSRIRRSYGDDQEGVQLLRVCACQYGMCGHCGQLDNHDKCTTWHGFAGNPRWQPLAWIQNRQGGCLTPVWPRHGKPCRWICPCQICRAGHDTAVRQVAYLQDTLFTTIPEARRAPRPPARRNNTHRSQPHPPGAALFDLHHPGA